MQNTYTRRRFLKSTTNTASALAFSASAYNRILGANDRIRIGIIGCGDRGQRGHMAGIQPHAKTYNAEIVAVCDPWRIRRQEAAQKVREWSGREPAQYVSYQDLVARDDIDAVTIASCNHQHTTHLEAAARTGKDIYCEKPLGMDFDRVKSACDTVRGAGVVFQAGTQLRSLPSMTGCKKLFETGVLGKISRIEQCRNASRPYWYRYLREARSEDVDWKEFLLDRPMRPFSAAQFTGWYGYRDFSDGPLPGIGSHFVDLVHYITGARFPASVVAHGGVLTWKDQYNFTCPDTAQATWVYPEGFLVSFSFNYGNGSGNTFAIFGDQGVMNLVKWTAPTISGAGAWGESALGGERPVPDSPRPDHFEDWLQCLHSRGTPHASLEAGYQHSVAVLMAVRAFDTGQRQFYDPEKREIFRG